MAGQLSESDTQALVDALYAVLALVGGADGEIDQGEEQRFTQMLAAAAQGEEPLRSVIATAQKNAPTRVAQAFANQEQALDKVRAALAVADGQLPGDAAESFRQGLYRMGKALAESSGGGFLGLGTRTSKTERDALAVLAACLDIRDP